jgi:DNA helicase II / ATP-dependent DNA helicase PcrA
MADLLLNLNEPQLAAVTLPPQHALILAGAGSGKTRVLTTRIAWLISTGQVSPAGILAVTFTNKAAKEMLTRLSAMLPINVRGMWTGTFHGLCNRLLRTHYRDAALPQTFQILDSADQLSAVKRLLKRLNVDDEKYPPKNLTYFINGCKEQGLRPGDVEINDDYNQKFVELYAAYDDQCQREGVVDFAELLLRSYELLQRNQPLREHYQARFRHILVDEFQDTNILQYKWLKILATPPLGPDGKTLSPPSAVFAVGDDDQSIYAFRGANVANMGAFEREFNVQNLIKLEQNYRSHGHILNAANALISHNENRLGKELWTDAGHGEQLRIYEAMTDGQEAQWMLEEVRGLIHEDTSRKDIAILYRSNAQSRVLEHALFSAGIPYRVYGGLRFFERAEVKHALAYLRLMENPNDDGAFLRVVNFPARGIGARSLEQLQDIARARTTSLYNAAGALTGAAAVKIQGFVKMIESLRFETQPLTLPEMVSTINERSGLIDFYGKEKEGQERIENLKELVNAAAAFLGEGGIGLDVPANFGVSSSVAPSADSGVSASGNFVQGSDQNLGQNTPQNTNQSAGQGFAAQEADLVAPGALLQITPLAGFLSHASLEAGDNMAAEGTDALQMMTIHSAKGLEFDAVFLTGVEEGLFPHENSVAELDGLEEERRLMYVAITRARKRLYISFSNTRMLHGQTRYSLKSRFVDELPEETLKWLTPRDRGHAGGGWNGRMDESASSLGWSGGSNYGGSRYGQSYSGAQQAASSQVTRIDPASKKFDRGIAFRIGQNVAHAKFGEGVIINIEGQGNDARVQVNFGREGVKWLALSLAKLEAA